MRTIRILLLLLLVAAASATYVVLRPMATEPVQTIKESVTLDSPPATLEVAPVVTPQSNAVAVKEKKPVQPLEERGDAMLFEIDALQNTPFDQAVTMPFD